MRASRIPSPALESTLILSGVLGRSREWLSINRGNAVKAGEARAIRAWFRERARRVPIQYLIGEWGFWNDSFVVEPGVLVPRPETETLVEAAIDVFRSAPTTGLRILEVGVGSGALLLSLLHEFPGSIGFGMDLSVKAVAIAELNASRLQLRPRVHLWRGDLLDAVRSQDGFDLIVFNPPYLTTAELRHAQREIRFEPREALDGGVDGLSYYRRAIPDGLSRVRDAGWMMVEVSPRRADRVRDLFETAGWDRVETRRDLGGRKRAVMGRKPVKEPGRG